MSKEQENRKVLIRVALFWGLYVGGIFLTGQLQPVVPAPFGPLMWGAASVPLVFLLNYLFSRYERRTLSEIWISLRKRDSVNLCLGLVIGLSFLPLTLATCALLAGPIEFQPAEAYQVPGILISCVQIALLVIMEELGFRAYALSSLVAALGQWKGQAITALAFALCHVLFGWSLQSILTGVLPSGLLFGAMALTTRSVSSAIGIHLGMNLAQWAIRDHGGLVRIVIDQDIQARVQTAAMIINLTLVLIWCLVFWWKGQRHEENQRN
jgi:membrane protease YdiL (CAAX protease family)